MLSNYSFPKTLKENYIDLDIIGGIQPNTEYALYITCDSTTLTNNCWCGFVTPDYGWSSNSVYYGDNTRYFVLKTNENVNNSKLRIRGDKGVTINHIRLIKLVTNSKYSRIERFLYALYSLDSSDLPTPLSRIEELYKCLVTGEEAPTFEPISRVEKYLMAILGVYDVNELPNPLSRVEVLLYKLATGDDNLDDIESFLSEHEKLLADIIRNGGVGGNIDIEYVLYTLSTEHNTLYNTAEKPVKSAILKGQTLVNIHPTKYIVNAINNTTFCLSEFVPKTMIKPNTRYFLRLYNTHQSIVRAYFKPCVNNSVNFISSDNKCAIFTTKSEFTANDLNNNKIHFYSSSVLALEDVKDTKVILCEYVYGMENWDIPYFEGMQSVKMPVLKTTGKNLFDPKYKNPDNYIDRGFYYSMPIDLIEGKEYKMSFNVDCNIAGCYFTFSSKPQPIDDGAIYSHIIMNGSINDEYYVANKTNYICFFSDVEDKFSALSNLLLSLNNVQLEEGSTATTYEPHKSNILTTNEEVTLRGIGEVKDELNCLTGQVTERIGEVILDGSEVWKQYRTMSDGSHNFICNKIDNIAKSYGKIISNNFPARTNLTSGVGLYINDGLSKLELSFKDLSTIEEVKSYLNNNNATIQYELTSESIKTVDLSVVDQDGNDTKLSTFNDITHVTLSSEGLIPEAELEVATKNKEDLEDSSVYTTHTLSEEFNTLYNTVEKPVKSAFLKGQTLVNLFDANNVQFYHQACYVDEDGYMVLPVVNKQYNNITIPKEKCSMFKPSTKYTLWVHMLENHTEENGDGTTEQPGSFMLESYDYGSTIIKNSNQGVYGCYFENNEIGVKSCVFETHDSETLADKTDGIRFDLPCYYAKTGGIQKLAIVILEGEYELNELPFSSPFEGMQSVQMPVLTTTGKNLISNWYNGKYIDDIGTFINKGGQVGTDFITIPTQGDYVCEDLKNGTVRFFDSNKQLIEKKSSINKSFNVPTGVKYVTFNYYSETYPSNLQLEKGTQSTPYEPFKSNILTVNEPVELNGIGEVRDELNLFTGKLTQRIGENGEVLSQEVVKTVDLSVVDQDGNDTKLSTFDDITHVALSSEGLIPEAELEVAEKVPEVAASMLTISREQEVINATTNEQSENVDATMIATTEIYEELL